MALNGLYGADVPLSNYSLTHSMTVLKTDMPYVTTTTWQRNREILRYM